MLKQLFNDNWSYAPLSFEFCSTPTKPFRSITLPHDALIHEERCPELPGGVNTGYYPYEAYEYRKSFDYDEAFKGEKISLLFEGVYAASKVYVNHQYAGGCMNGYIPFIVELSPYLKEGKNEISVICRTYRDSRWYSGAGIYRNVWLLTSGQAHFTYGKSFVSTKRISDQHADIEVSLVLKNDSFETKYGKLSMTVTDRNGGAACRSFRTVTLFPGEEKTVRQRLTVENPDLWSCETPDLYTLTAQIFDKSCSIEDEDLSPEDTEKFHFGIRTLSLSKTEGLLLNGTSVKLRGACIHHDNGILGSCGYFTSAYRKLKKLKEAGVNAVRIAHHPAGSEVLCACDSLGILVMNEGFDAWTFCKTPYDYGLHFDNEWETVVDRMVESSRNHPSVILYSLGNEIIECGNPKGADTAWKLNERIKSLDPDRYTVLCLNVLLCLMDQKPDGDEPESRDVNEAMAEHENVFKAVITSREAAERVEEAFGYADIAGYNYGDSRYLIDERDYPDRIIVGSETFSEDLCSNWELVKSHPQILGDFNWTGWDYLGESCIGLSNYDENAERTAYPARTAYCGDFDIIGTRRAQSYYREAVWEHSNMPAILVMNPRNYGKKAERTPWSFFDGLPHWDYPGFEGQMTEVEVYSRADEIELLINGRSLGRKPAGKAASFVTRFELPYESGILCAVSYAGGEEVSRRTLRSGEGISSVVVLPERIQGKNERLRYVTIENQYENGVTNMNAAVTVHVEVNGGTLLALGSADPKGTRSFDDNECELFQGKAQAVIRDDGSAEIIVTTV